MNLRVNKFARPALRAGVLAAAAMLASCGGGGTTGNTFTAKRVLAFGDETSVINANGSKYSVNALVTGSTAFDCASNPLWIQAVAVVYGLAFPQCNKAVNGLEQISRIYATNGATVAGVAAQVDLKLLDGSFQAGDLVTVLAGVNDVVAQFAQYPGVGEPQLLANVDAAGKALAVQVNRMAALGARVLISTIPDVGLMPFAGDRSAGSTNANPALLSRLSTRFNDAMLATLTNDGHKIGLIQLDEFLRATDTATRLGRSTYANSTLASCTVALPDCTTNTLVTEATTSLFLWADDRHFGPSAQLSLGSLALTRAQNNPF